MQAEENAEVAKARITQAERGKNVESGLARPKTVEEFRTILVHLLHHTPFRYTLVAEFEDDAALVRFEDVGVRACP
jgi:hypothetical protein